MTHYYPIQLNLHNKRCIVVGGGTVAERKVRELLACEAQITVIAGSLTATLDEWADAGRIALKRRDYQSGDLLGAIIVIAATDDSATNHAVAAEARKSGVLVNVVDDPERCDFTVPAVIRRRNLVVAISTDGRSPAFARWLRIRLESELGPEYGGLLDLVAECRDELVGRGQRPSAERWQMALSAELLELVKSGRQAEARTTLREKLGLE